MKTFRIVFANIFQGFIFAGDDSNHHVFKKFWPGQYINIFKEKKPDILCLAESLIDNKELDSEFVNKFKHNLQMQSSVNVIDEQSWIFENKYYGQTILTKEKLLNSSSFEIPKPQEKIEAIGPDGSLWVMHDKIALSVNLKVNESTIRIINLHYFPFHRFGRRLDEVAFKEIREDFVKMLDPGDTPTIVTGDFNNKGMVLTEVYPELFKDNHFKTAIEVDTTLKGSNDQIDHILYTPDSLEVINTERLDIPSDHYGLLADFRFT